MPFPAHVADPGTQLNFDLLSKFIYYGAGTPVGRVTATGPALYFRSDSAAGASVYAHQDAFASTAWAAVA